MKAKLRVVSLEELNRAVPGTAMEAMGIRFTGIGPGHVEARMPVDHRTFQVHRLLHGGASVVLAETLGSVGALLTIDPERFRAVGIEINANHVGSVKAGEVVGVAQPIHLGRSTQVWDVRITADGDRLVCVARLTLAIIEAPTS